MEEKLIEFKTAKLAKNRGFDWDCVNHYSQEDCIGDEYHTFQDDTNNKECEHFEYSAPTQSLLQRWLREEHDISIVVIANSKKQFFVDYRYFDQCVDDDSELVLLHGRIFNSYEDALENGLIEALKIIEHV